MKEKIIELYNKDNIKAYQTMKEIEIITAEKDELYNYFDELLKMIENEKTFIRVRGFIIICNLSKWDKENKINKNIDKILTELEDNTSTSIRQCLKSINLILLYKPELSIIIKNKLDSINISKYKESMQSLIKKDINNIIKDL